MRQSRKRHTPVREGAARSRDRATDAARYEIALEEARPGDRRDTSTARALAEDLWAYTVGDALEAADRDTLNDWLRGNTTGGELIRAGVPGGWVVGDKTDADGYGTPQRHRGDLATGSPPIVLAVLSSRDDRDGGYDNRLIAEATQAVLAGWVVTG